MVESAWTLERRSQLVQGSVGVSASSVGSLHANQILRVPDDRTMDATPPGNVFVVLG
jgi:hypothetical protein